MNKIEKNETKILKKIRRKQSVWQYITVAFVFLCMVLVFPAYAVISPELPENLQSNIVFSKNFLEWSTHSIDFQYSPDGENSRYVKINIEDPFKVNNVDFSTEFYNAFCDEIAINVELVDPARNTIQCNIWIRVIDNSDLMVFLEYINKDDRNLPLNYAIKYHDENIIFDEDFEKPKVKVFRYSGPDYWEDTTKLSIVDTLEGECFGEAMYGQYSRNHNPKSSFFKGNLFPYKISEYGIIQHIDNVEAITYTELNKNSEWKISNHTTLLEHSSLRDWYVLSANPLMDIESAVTQRVMIITDFGLKKNYFQDGFYYSTYFSGYKNESPQGFYWDYSMYAPRSFLEYYYNEDERFLYDICINSFYALVKTQNSDGYWTNGTVSKWLVEEYGIEDRYFDTRFCTDAALFMIRLYENFDIKLAKEMSCKIGDLLVEGIRKGFCYETSNYGFMLQDYFIFDRPEIKVHSSLNHLLNEASFLMLLGEVTNVETYTNASIRIINSLNATDNFWKNLENHDLHYARLPSGKYGLQDYLTLTYYDLIRFRSFIKNYMEQEPQFVQNLGKWKEDFLIKKNIVHTSKFTGNGEDLSPLVKKDEKK